MTAYELHIYPIPLPPTATPLDVEPLEAADDDQAIDRMREFAKTLPRNRCVYLHKPGQIRSLASEDGLA